MSTTLQTGDLSNMTEHFMQTGEPRFDDLINSDVEQVYSYGGYCTPNAPTAIPAGILQSPNTDAIQPTTTLQRLETIPHVSVPFHEAGSASTSDIFQNWVHDKNPVSETVSSTNASTVLRESSSENVQTAIEIPSSGAPGSKLAALLAQDANGRIIVKSYIHHKSFLNLTARKYLVSFIIDIEVRRALMRLSPFGDYKLKEFTYYSKEISGLFPSESGSGYFSPFQNVNGARKDPCGKLWEHYNYVKSVLRDQGVLARKSDKRNDEAATQTVHINESDAKKLKWLETTSSPLHELLSLWKETFVVRREILLKEQKSVNDYFDSFVGLRMQEGTYLIQSDFDHLYPNQSSALLSKWEVIKEHLISTVRTSKAIKNVDDKALALVLPTFSVDQQAFAIFHLLAAIVPQDRTGKKRKASEKENPGSEVRKTSVQERRDSFTLRVPVAAELHVALTRVRNDLQRRGETFQPTPVVVGGVTDIEACYVAVNDTLYEVKSYIDAIDLAFKIVFATNCKYPDRSKVMWQLVQMGIFGIDDDKRKATTWAKFLSQELQTVFARQSHG